MFDWLRSLRCTRPAPRGRRGNPSAQSALVQTLEPRQMLTLLTTDGGFPIGTPFIWGDVGVGGEAFMKYQTESEYWKQHWEVESWNNEFEPGKWRSTTVSQGNIIDTSDYPGGVWMSADYTMRDGGFPRFGMETMTIRPFDRWEYFGQENMGDRAFVYARAKAYAEDIFVVDSQGVWQQRWQYAVDVNNLSLVIDQDTPETYAGGGGYASGLIRAHIGDNLNLSATPSLPEPPEDPLIIQEWPLEAGVSVQSFTVDAAAHVFWTTNDQNEPALVLKVHLTRSNFSSPTALDDPWDPLYGTWDSVEEQLTDPGLVAGTKVKLVWSTTLTSAGAVGDAYEVTLGSREDNGYELITDFLIDPADLADAPPDAKYLVAVVDTDDHLWERNESNNEDYLTPFVDYVNGHLPGHQFGPYVKDVPLPTTFTVDVDNRLGIVDSMRYTVTGPGGFQRQGVVPPTATPGEYAVTIDVGTLPPGNLPLKIELLNASGQAIDRATFNGTIVILDQNTSPITSGLPANQSVNDTATISPFAAITVNDPNNQNMLAKVTILNGTVRGDFTAASTTGWTRSLSGNNIVYSRFYNPQANIGAVVQAALRGFVYVPRKNVIKPNTTELTDIQVFVNDGVANTTANTRLTTTSVNDAPTFGGTTANVAANDNATVNPFTALTVSDVDMQEMLISVTILNGTVRGDFTAASTTGWAVRYVLGNNITYKRYFGPQANVGAAAQAAFRALVFQPRQNAIKPGTTEATDFQVTISDGVAPAVLGTGTRVITTSVNNAPTIAGAAANQTMNDNQTKAVFSTLTVTDPDNQDKFVRITITNGTTRGDFTPASTTGWTRKLSGTNILYERYFAATTNNGALVQSVVRALVFQPRTNVPIGTTETTSLTVFVNDGLASATNSTTSVITTGIAPRPAIAAASTPPIILHQDVETIVIPSIQRPASNPLARLLKKTR